MTSRGDLPPRLRDLLGGLGARIGIEDTKSDGMRVVKVGRDRR